MRVITSVRTACCLPLLTTALAAPAAASVQLDSGTGLQASREVANPPPADHGRSGANRPGTKANRNRTTQASGAGARTPPSGGKNTPP